MGSLDMHVLCSYNETKVTEKRSLKEVLKMHWDIVNSMFTSVNGAGDGSFFNFHDEDSE